MADVVRSHRADAGKREGDPRPRQEGRQLSAGALRCPCGTGLGFVECCGRFHGGEPAPTAEALMRSRFSAFALGDAAYLLATWHPSTRPAALDLDPGVRWIRLDILDRVAGGPLAPTGIVEFEAHYAGGSQRERSEFVREAGRWYYVAAAG